MEKKILTARQMRERGFLLRAPLIAIPVLTLIFWGVGGGKGMAEGKRLLAKGFNMLLPAAHVASIIRLDKMGYYEQARRDSTAERQKSNIEDHYAKILGLETIADSGHLLSGADPAVRQVQARLEELKRALAGSGFKTSGEPGAKSGERAAETARAVARAVMPHQAAAGGRADANEWPVAQPTEMERLEKTLLTLQRVGSGNSDVAGLSTVVDRLASIAALGHDTVRRRPEAPARRPETPARRPVISVKALPDETDTLPGFDSSAIEAIVPEAQTLVSGAELRMELVRDILIGGQRIPAGTLLFGVANLSGERLRVSISAIAYQERVIPVSLAVADEDGLAGIYIPGAPVSEAMRESASQELGAVGPTLLTTDLAGQAAGAGVTLARSLIGKKIRPVHVTIPAGYHLLLHPENFGL